MPGLVLENTLEGLQSSVFVRMLAEGLVPIRPWLASLCYALSCWACQSVKCPQATRWGNLSYLTSFFFTHTHTFGSFFFWTVLGIQQNWEEDTEFPYPPCPLVCKASPILSIPHRSGTLVTTDEPAMTHHYHPESIVYTRAHSWCCTFCGWTNV